MTRLSIILALFALSGCQTGRGRGDDYKTHRQIQDRQLRQIEQIRHENFTRKYQQILP